MKENNDFGKKALDVIYVGMNKNMQVGIHTKLYPD